MTLYLFQFVFRQDFRAYYELEKWQVILNHWRVPAGAQPLSYIGQPIPDVNVREYKKSVSSMPVLRDLKKHFLLDRNPKL